MRALVLSLLLALALIAGVGAAKASETECFYFTLGVTDTLYTPVPAEFTSIRVWTTAVRGVGSPGLIVYRTVQRGWGKSLATEKSPKNTAWIPMRRSGFFGSQYGHWNEYPGIGGSGFTVKNFQSVVDTFYVEVMR